MGWRAIIFAAVVVPLLAVLFWPGTQPAKAGPSSSANVTCNVLWVHDGDTFRCDGYRKSTRLYGVDAPEMPGACREGRQCVAGDPYASRDYLAALIGDTPLACQHIETDRYQRPVMRCWAGSADLSCAMVQAGHAVKRYGNVRC